MKLPFTRDPGAWVRTACEPKMYLILTEYHRGEDWDDALWHGMADDPFTALAQFFATSPNVAAGLYIGGVKLYAKEVAPGEGIVYDVCNENDARQEGGES